ncbi:hypothetical protein BsWGS_10703 [Bradybaena similaris]
MRRKLSQLSSKGVIFKSMSVVDYFSASTDVKYWCLSFVYESEFLYEMRDTENIEIPFTDFRRLLERKIQFVEHLFKEMQEVRKEAVHVAVIFLYGPSLTQEEITSVPSILQQQNTGVKIFVVIFGNRLAREPVHLTDTLVLPDINNYNSAQYLLMAMCHTCPKDWFIFEHKTGLTMISCYRIFQHSETWTESMQFCKHLSAQLAIIETVEEMTFLKNRLSELLLKEMNLTGGHIAIGLSRDLSNYAKRFHWVTAGGSYRPLVVQHWLPGEPAARCCSPGCGVWQFSSNFTNDVNRSSLSQDVISDGFVEGWADTGCYRLASYLSLCEIDLPQRVSGSASITIASAHEESVNSTLTTNKRNLRKYRENIVSVSANVGNREFLQDLRKSEKDFPIFDCGEIAGDNRFVSYSMVCDSFDHCSNRMDESSCMKLRTDENFCLSGRRQQIVPKRCDNVKDCVDGSDEMNCILHPCDSVRCSDGSCLPPEWVEDGEFDCFTDRGPDSSETDESSHSHREELFNKRCVFTCKSDEDPYKCIGLDQLNDSVPHCTGPEGPLDETIGKLESANTSTCKSKTGQLIWAPKCHYIKDRYGGSIGCRDMSHLRDCEQFECGHGYVKCLDSYCIPLHYLRDGRTDCPSGEDENLFYIGLCVGNFACWDSQICLHPDLVCNGHPDCPQEDDELDCHSNCPQGFRCVAGTVTVSDYNRSVPFDINELSEIDNRTRYMDLTGIKLNEFDTLVAVKEEVFLNLQVLILSKCNISDLYLPTTDRNTRNVSQSMIKHLDISYNVIHELFSHVVYTTYYRNIQRLNASYNTPLRSLKNLRFRFLEILDLSHTSIAYLNDLAFVELSKLKYLNLSYTLISDFSRRYFATNLTLHSLDLRGVPAKHFQDYVFHNLTISESLYTDHVQLCCPQIKGLKMPSHACIAPVDVESISSCSHLVDLRVQRILLWLVAALAVVGNTTVIVYRLIWDRSILKTGYGLFVTNLGVSDFFMGIYLLIIAGADHFYRGNYVLYDRYWRASDVCTFAGFIACISCEASTFFAFLITLDRYLVMKFPFGQIKLSSLHKTIAVTMSWLASFLLSLVPIVFSFDIYSSNAMCLGLPLTNTHVEGWGYSLGVFAIFNFIMFLVIAYGQYAIFRTLSENKMTKAPMSMRSSRRTTEIIVAKQLCLVVLSNFLFWFPVGLICLLSLAGHEVSNEVYTWTTVLLLPVNSAANPILYTIPALMARWEQFKHGDQRTTPPSL